MSCDVAVDPLDGIGGGEGQHAREHLVERGPKGIEIAPGADGPVHAAGLFGRHVRAGARNSFGRLGSMALAWQVRSNTTASKPNLARPPLPPAIGRLYVRVHATGR